MFVRQPIAEVKLGNLFDQSAFIIFGVVATIGIVRLLKISKQPIELDTHHSNESSEKIISLDVLIAFCALVFLHGSMSITSSFLPLFIQETLREKSSVTGIALGLCAFVEISVIAFFAKFSELAPSKTMIAGCIAGILYFSLVINADSASTLIYAQILNGTFIAAMVAIGLVWMQGIKGGGASIKTALFVNAYNVGAMILTPIVGYIIAYQGI